MTKEAEIIHIKGSLQQIDGKGVGAIHRHLTDEQEEEALYPMLVDLNQRECFKHIRLWMAADLIRLGWRKDEAKVDPNA